jgi:hypothetical protein
MGCQSVLYWFPPSNVIHYLTPPLLPLSVSGHMYVVIVSGLKSCHLYVNVSLTDFVKENIVLQ